MDFDTFSSRGLIQTLLNGISEFTLPTLVAGVVLSLALTRIITGFRSFRGKVEPEEPRDVRMVPYWTPWLGHGIYFFWNHLNLFDNARLSLTPRPMCAGEANRDIGTR